MPASMGPAFPSPQPLNSTPRYPQGVPPTPNYFGLAPQQPAPQMGGLGQPFQPMGQQQLGVPAGQRPPFAAGGGIDLEPARAFDSQVNNTPRGWHRGPIEGDYRVDPRIPSYVPPQIFHDDIFRSPTDPAAAQRLDFDNMEMKPNRLGYAVGGDVAAQDRAADAADEPAADHRRDSNRRTDSGRRCGEYDPAAIRSGRA